MTSRLIQRSGFSRALLLLVLIALVPRFMVPSGFMPGNAGTLTVMLCSGETSITIDVGKRSDSEHGTSTDHVPCVFSAAAMPAMASTPPLLLALALLHRVRESTRPDPAPAIEQPLRLWPPLRGPPSV